MSIDDDCVEASSTDSLSKYTSLYRFSNESSSNGERSCADADDAVPTLDSCADTPGGDRVRFAADIGGNADGEEHPLYPD